MAYPYKKILCPIDLDENSLAALDAAAEIAGGSDATVVVLHVVPIILQPGGTPMYVDVYTALEQEAQAKLVELAKVHLAGVKCELKTTVAEPSAAILNAQNTIGADVIVMGTHGRLCVALTWTSASSVRPLPIFKPVDIVWRMVNRLAVLPRAMSPQSLMTLLAFSV